MKLENEETRWILEPQEEWDRLQQVNKIGEFGDFELYWAIKPDNCSETALYVVGKDDQIVSKYNIETATNEDSWSYVPNIESVSVEGLRFEADDDDGLEDRYPNSPWRS